MKKRGDMGAALCNYSYLALRDSYTQFFVQDAWKVTCRLTINLGLRYELSPPALQKNNTISSFDLDSTTGQPRLVPAGSEGDDRSSRALMAVNYHQFAPRFGFAYALPDDKTVIRGAMGSSTRT
jgi:outer membrane receptor protein involved in Fe transport